MDFLSKYETKINYKKKNVWFSVDNGEQFTFRKGQVFSIMINGVKARKMLSKRCITYLTHIVNR